MVDKRKLTPDQATAAIVKLLQDVGAAERWTVQDKGVLTAAIKQQLRKQGR